MFPNPFFICSSSSFCPSYFNFASCSMTVTLVVIMFSILAGFFVCWWSSTCVVMHYGQRGSMHPVDLHIFVIEYSYNIYGFT